MKRENLADESNWQSTLGYSQAVRGAPPHPSFSPDVTAVAVGLTSAILVLCGWRYLPNLIYVSLLSYFTPLPLIFGATAFLAHRYPAIRQRLTILISVSFESVILVQSIVLGSPLDVLAIQLLTGMIPIGAAGLAAYLGARWRLQAG